MPESLNYDRATHAKAPESAELESLRVRVAALETACADGQQACREAQHSLQTFITYSPVAILLLDIETERFIEANPMAEQLFGFPRTTLLEMGPAELSPPNQPDGSSSTLANQKITQALSGGDPVFEWWHRNARGERIPCEIGLTRMWWCGRDVIRGAIVDISARKKLELSERGRRRLLESIQAEGYWEGEIWNRRKDGHEYLQRLTITCVKNAHGETTHYVGDGQDITEEKIAAADRAAIQAARKVQESLFPSEPPNIPGFDIAGAVHPAELVSGDFFDFMAIGQTSVGVLIADVSGHGLGPALLMAQTQA